MQSAAVNWSGEHGQSERFPTSIIIWKQFLIQTNPLSHLPYNQFCQYFSPTGNCRHYFQLITENAWLGALGRVRFRSSQMAIGTCQASVVRRIVKYNKIVVDRRSFSDFPATPSTIILRVIFSRAGFAFDEVGELPEEIAAEWYTAMWSTGHEIRDLTQLRLLNV